MFLVAPVDQPDPSLRWIPLFRPLPPDQPVRPLLSFPSPLWFLAAQLVRPLLADQPALSHPPGRSAQRLRSHQPLPQPLSLLALLPGQSARPRLSFLEDQSALWFPPRPSHLPDRPPLSSPAVQPPLGLRLLLSLLPDQSARPRPAVQSLRLPPRFPSLPLDQSVRPCPAVQPRRSILLLPWLLPDRSARPRPAVRLPLSFPSFLEDRSAPSLLVVLAIPQGSDSCSHCPILRACRWQSTVCIDPLPALARVGQGQPR